MDTVIKNIESFRNRRGVLRCSREMIDQILEGRHEALAAHAAIFSEFVVVRSEMHYAGNCVKHEGFHPQFKEVAEGVCSDNLEYRAEIIRTTDEHGITTFSCKMVLGSV